MAIQERWTDQRTGGH